MPSLFGKWPQREWKQIRVLDSPVIQNEGLTAYIPRYMVIKKGVIKHVPEDMELEKLMQRLNSDNHTFPHHWRSQTYNESQRDERRNRGSFGGCGKGRGQYVWRLELRNVPLIYIFAIWKLKFPLLSHQYYNVTKVGYLAT
jgi:hypothetical protein